MIDSFSMKIMRGVEMLTFRKCTMNDLQQLQDLSKKTYRDTFGGFCSKEIMQAYLSEAFRAEKISQELNNPCSAFYFAYDNESLAGYIKVNDFPAQTDINDKNSLELERIYLLLAFQGRGYGKELLDKAVCIAAQKRKKYLWLGVWEKNLKAIGFYSKNGFYRSGEHVFVMGNEQQHDYIMKKELANLNI